MSSVTGLNIIGIKVDRIVEIQFIVNKIRSLKLHLIEMYADLILQKSNFKLCMKLDF